MTFSSVKRKIQEAIFKEIKDNNFVHKYFAVLVLEDDKCDPNSPYTDLYFVTLINNHEKHRTFNDLDITFDYEDTGADDVRVLSVTDIQELRYILSSIYLHGFYESF